MKSGLEKVARRCWNGSLGALLLGLFSACGVVEESPAAGTTAADANVTDSTTEVETATRVVSFDGVPIAYQRFGSGEPAVVLVHGWACDQTFWAEQVPALAEGFTVVTLDLAGHGKSGVDRQHWGVAGFGEDIRAVVDQLDLEQVVLVGHSMGGPAVLEAAQRLKGRVLGVVGVDTFRDAESHADTEQWRMLIDSYRQDFVGTCGQFVSALFRPDAPVVLVADVEARMCDIDPAIGLALLESFSHYRLDATLGFVAAPIRAINSDLFPTRVGVNQRYAPEFEAEVMRGLGHFPMLERPAEFNELLRQAVDDLAARWIDLGEQDVDIEGKG